MSSGNGSPASSLRYSSTSCTEPGATSSVACSWAKWVPVTASSPNRSLMSAAMSSRPVPSTKPADLVCPMSAVALAPAQVRLPLDHVLELDDPVHQRLGTGRAAGDVDVDGHELVGALDDRVVVEHAGAGRADAHGDHPLGLEHLVVDAADDRRHLDRDAAGQDDHVRLARGGAEHLGPEARRVHPRRADHADHLDRAAGEAEGERPRRVGAGPVLGLLERREADALLHVLLEVGVIQLAAQELAGAELLDLEVVAVVPERLAAYLHSSAPLRHTYTKATNSSTMKTIVSISTKLPAARSTTAIG